MAENSLNDTEVVLEGEDEVPFDDRELPLKGMHMLLNNGFDEAFELFKKYKEESPLMLAGYSFVFFMQALMSFEEEKLEEALKMLQETEKKCEVGDGFVKSIKKKLSKKKKRTEQQISVEDKIQRQVITADSLLYQAILVFTNQDIPSYVKGGWLLRKAYKIYEKLYKEMTGLRERQGKLKESSSYSSLNASSDGPIDGNDNEIPSEVLDMLQGAVNFGYGTFQLCISLVPPKILKIIEFLGFEGDREVGLKALLYTSHSKDMKAPLAVLGLLWYHTVLRPFFALDGANEYDGGCVEAEAIIAENTEIFPNSPLFLFFKGRIHRLRKQVDSSLTCYNQALDAAAGQREVELMCLYEIGWCNLMKLKWRESLTCFTRLKEETKWSKCYYTYLEAVAHASKRQKKAIFMVTHTLKRQKKAIFMVAHGSKRQKKAIFMVTHASKRQKTEIFMVSHASKRQKAIFMVAHASKRQRKEIFMVTHAS
ncbi:hypothetical protein CHS0354_025726 [Potamilus streckersoni]|uniref:Tetratricopeptide repeat protein 39C n=1 Tax=Potamilus streckersoni TaxID=2493646 RepID=A0AAE0S0P5_9BIVA|nr:hypothetical protein CHS0354_025726 [Potamilus streckersoni]